MDWARRFFDYAGNMKGGLLRETPGAEDIRKELRGRIFRCQQLYC